MELMEVIKARRAYRSLAPTEITDELIETVGRAVSLAPSCFNNQPWRFVFVRDPETLERVCSAMPEGNRWARQASLIVAVFSRRDLDCPTTGREYYIFDSGMATAYLILGLTDLGLVAHPIAGYREDGVKEALGIPEEMTVLTLVIVGKKSDEISPVLSETQVEGEKNRPPRLELPEFVHRDRYRPAG